MKQITSADDIFRCIFFIAGKEHKALLASALLGWSMVNIANNMKPDSSLIRVHYEVSVNASMIKLLIWNAFEYTCMQQTY